MECHFLTKYRFVTIKYTFDVSQIFITHAYIDRHLAVNKKHASSLRLYSIVCFIKLKLNSCETSKKTRNNIWHINYYQAIIIKKYHRG